MLGKSGAIDFEKVSEWQQIEDKNVLFAKTDDPYQEAKMQERRSLEQNDVFEPVNDSGQCRITTRWFPSENENGRKKARLVAQGFQEDQEDLGTDSPTCAKETFRLLIASKLDWQCEILDVKTAFRRGNPLKRDIFIVPPKEWDENCLWRLRKGVLLDASRHWYDRVRNKLVKIESCAQ